MKDISDAARITHKGYSTKKDLELLDKLEALRFELRTFISKYNHEKHTHDLIKKSLDNFYIWENKRKEFKSKQKAYPLLRNLKSYNEFRRQHSELQLYIEDRLRSHLNELLPSIKNAIFTLLNDYFTDDNDCIEISLHSESFDKNKVIPDYNLFYKRDSEIWPFLQFNIKIKSSGGGADTEERKDINPRAYLNTFKYKLFIVAFKLACCCVAKKIYNINYPLIIDDVFDSSDFNNRVGIKEFISDLFRQHDKFLPDESHQLQLIFFTQDNLIADQVEKGINSYYLYRQNENNRSGEAKYSRIYDYHEIDPEKDFHPQDCATKKDVLPLYYSIEEIIS